MPSRWKSFRVSLLPMPMEPVRPTVNGRSWRLSGIAKRLGQSRAQIRRHFWRDAEPGGKGGHGLMHQHAQPIDGAVAASTRLAQKLGLQRIVDNVRDRGFFGQTIEREFELGLSDHSETGRIDEQLGAGEGLL